MSAIEYDVDSSNREYKASAFTAYFGEPENAADLYRGLSHCPDIRPSDIEYKTLKGVLFLARKNDLAFTVQKKILVVGEHQSTINQNMPLRSAIYYGRTIENLIPPRAIYKSSLLKIPTPEFYLFYNGSQTQPAEKILKLSDAYLDKTDIPMLELTVRMININPLLNHPLLKESRCIYEYASFIQSIRNYIEEDYGRDQAISAAMEQCISEGIMVDFIQKHGSEVRNMLFTQFNLEDAKEVWREEAYEEGMEAGIRDGKQLGLREGLLEGRQKGLQEGRQEGICCLIKICKEFQLSQEDTLQRIISQFQLELPDAQEYMDRYWPD